MLPKIELQAIRRKPGIRRESLGSGSLVGAQSSLAGGCAAALALECGGWQLTRPGMEIRDTPADQLPHSNYETVIQPNQSWLSVDWRALLEFRDLLGLLVRRDFVSKYKQTLLGPAWFVLQPLLTTVMFTIIFGRVARIPTDGMPARSSICAACSAGITSRKTSPPARRRSPTTRTFSAKVYFPRLIVPLSIVVSNLLAFALQVIPFFTFFIYLQA